MNRIKQRNREGENIEIEYLYNLHDYHHRWLIANNRVMNNNILLLDGDYSFDTNIKHFDDFVFENNSDSEESNSSDILVSTKNIRQFQKFEFVLYYFVFPMFNILIVSLPFVYPYLPNYFKQLINLKNTC